MTHIEGGFTNAIKQIQLATEELRADNEKAKMKYKERLERKAWQQGLNDEYAQQTQLESMMGDY